MSGGSVTKQPVLATVIRTHSEHHLIDADRDDMRAQYPNALIKKYRREVCCEGLVFPVHILIVREAVK